MKNTVLSIGSQFPDFNKKAVVSIEKGNEFYVLSYQEIKGSGKWMVLFWWPKDFTFVGPTEIAEFNKHYKYFADRETVLIGASMDSEFVHVAWRRNHDDLRNLHFP